MPDCKYLVAPDEYELKTVHMGDFRPAPAPLMLCAWAIYHPASGAALTDTPDWLVRNAMAGHLWRDGDCDRCPCFERGEPVETPRVAA